MKKTFITLAIISLLFSGCTPDESKYKSEVPVSEPVSQLKINKTNQDLPKQENNSSLTLKSQEEDKNNNSQPTSNTLTAIQDSLPEEFNLDVQFYSQAPKADWGMPYQEACEEASLILAHNYVTLQTMTLEEFDQAIRDMVDWQIETYGVHKDLTIEEVGTIAEKYLGYQNFEIVNDPTPTQIKEFLAEGYPIVAPAAGRQLGNPFFTDEGPIYHMLVIKGYEEGQSGPRFITNDVGTRRGENFVYDEGVFMSALHDWVEGSLKEPALMNRGPKRIMVLK